MIELTATQTQLAAAKTDNPTVALLITTLLESGATLKEILQLQGKHIRKAQLQLPNRQVTISTQLSHKLSQPTPSEHVFSSREGAALSPRRAQQLIKAAFENIGLQATATNIRYAHINQSLKQGICIEAIRRQTGLSESRIAAIAKTLPPTKNEKILDEKEATELLETAKTKDQVLLRTLLELGLKVGEVIKLRGKDLKKTTLHIGGRKLPLSPQLAVDLHNIGALSKQPLFPGRAGSAISARAVQKKVKKYLQNFKHLQATTPQVLRETAIYRDVAADNSHEIICTKYGISQERLNQIIAHFAGSQSYERWTL